MGSSDNLSWRPQNSTFPQMLLKKKLRDGDDDQDDDGSGGGGPDNGEVTKNKRLKKMKTE